MGQGQRVNIHIVPEVHPEYEYPRSYGIKRVVSAALRPRSRFIALIERGSRYPGMNPLPRNAVDLRIPRELGPYLVATYPLDTASVLRTRREISRLQRSRGVPPRVWTTAFLDAERRLIDWRNRVMAHQVARFVVDRGRDIQHFVVFVGASHVPALFAICRQN